MTTTPTTHEPNRSTRYRPPFRMKKAEDSTCGEFALLDANNVEILRESYGVVSNVEWSMNSGHCSGVGECDELALSLLTRPAQ